MPDKEEEQRESVLILSMLFIYAQGKLMLPLLQPSILQDMIIFPFHSSLPFSTYYPSHLPAYTSHLQEKKNPAITHDHWMINAIS